ncbi:MAG: hypothetical protein WD599_01400 [Balneolaceae bacterium]
MPENNNEKDSFEEFFQKKAGEYDIPFREEDWLKLEKKLDLRDAQMTYRRRVRWIAAAAVLIVSLLGYFTYENHNRLNEISRQLTDESVSESEQEPLADELTNGEDSVPDTNVQTDEESIAVNESGEGQVDRLINLRGDPILPVPGLEFSVNRGQADPGFLQTDGLLEIREIKAERLVSEFSTTSYPYRSLTNRALIPARTELASATLPHAVSPERIDKESSGSTSSRIRIGIATAPDLSTAGSVSDFHDPGYKFGATLEYQLGPNLSVSTGLIQSRVRYTAGSRDYKSPVYWTGGISPDEIIADCLILDIPVNIKVDVMNFNRSRFFVSAGVSSYIMLNEVYDFNYEYEGDVTGLMKRWSGKTGTRHWFSNAGFSVGYELDVHRNWSLRAEPFMKIPLNEVGWGNVNLYSMGSFISLNYRL